MLGKVHNYALHGTEHLLPNSLAMLLPARHETARLNYYECSPETRLVHNGYSSQAFMISDNSHRNRS